MSDYDGEQCPRCETALGYEAEYHAIGINVWGEYDGVLYWLCPVCGYNWNRWAVKDGRRYVRAQKFVDEANALHDAQPGVGED